MKSFVNAFKNISFKGRVSSGDFWRFVGINTLIFILILLVPTFMSVIFNTDTFIFFYILLATYSIIVFLPSFTMQVKRLHDINKSGNWLFIYLIPYIGCIILLILFCEDGDPYENKYGASPKDAEINTNQINNHNTIEPDVNKLEETEQYISQQRLLNDQPNNKLDICSVETNTNSSAKKVKMFRTSTIILAVSLIVNLAQIGTYLNLYHKYKNDKNYYENKIKTDKEYYEGIISRQTNLLNNYNYEQLQIEGELNFYEHYAVIVTEADNYYHQYDCPYLNDDNGFWIYNISAAEDCGYTPCPYCR